MLDVSSAPAPASHSVVRELLKPRFAHRVPNAVPPDRVPEVIPEKRVEPEIALTTPSAATSVNLNKPKDVLGPSQPLEPKLLERTEIPNTPSQRSSQFDSSIPEHLPENLPNARVSQQNTSTQDDEDALALDDLSHTHNQVPFTALCSGCRKQTALVKAGEKDAHCFLNTCSAHVRGQAWVNNGQDQPLVLFRSRSGKDPAGYREDTPAPDALVTSQETSLEQSAPIEVTSIAETLGQKTMSPNEIIPERSSSNSASVPRVNEPRERSVQPAETSDLDDLARTSGPYVFRSGSTHNSDLLGEDESRNPGSTIPEPTEVGTHMSPKHPSTNCLPDRAAPAAAKEQESAVSKSNETVERDSNIFESPIEAHSGPSIPTKRHTNRDLARIALVCAQGTGMTALEIIDWLALRFSYLKKGQGAWEKSLKSVLSHQPEFYGVKPSGRPYERVVYNFTSTANRAKYEEEYHEYLPLPPVLGPQDGHGNAMKITLQRAVADNVMQNEGIQDEQPTQIKRRTTRAIKSAPSRRNAITHDSLPTPMMEEVSTDVEPGYNPFERATVSRLTRAPVDDLEAQRGTDFRSAYSPNIAPSIETMTSEEKAAKIEEIKARPSRKQFFGANWRLAHVRKYGREDIHDESDGAWKSHHTAERSTAGRDSAPNDRDENQSLLQVFNLPTNTRPFSDGNELVFRNVTLVNGRLPRSRQAYRVGKVFGGELTIN
ncbi:uncharacterized protein J4E78_010763 [Alternaria triticimaculans]|uniref:uncharacterized protein n=1 Tax=Alternaria triticimaculans TaxID=297637 RepID=UPI0020C49F74|nr:uncharacterized protein J4E78_010763 [Alternaria triticimaculans]KAI4640178.1 hypothetical protein J4E78_010763 [Alternaria triticimaculans]